MRTMEAIITSFLSAHTVYSCGNISMLCIFTYICNTEICRLCIRVWIQIDLSLVHVFCFFFVKANIVRWINKNLLIFFSDQTKHDSKPNNLFVDGKRNILCSMLNRHFVNISFPSDLFVESVTVKKCNFFELK